MTAQPVAPVIPSRARLAVRAGGKAGPVRRLPLAAAMPEAPVLPDEVLYGSDRMDVSAYRSGRAASRCGFDGFVLWLERGGYPAGSPFCASVGVLRAQGNVPPGLG